MNPIGWVWAHPDTGLVLEHEMSIKTEQWGRGKKNHRAGSQYETIIPTVTTVKIETHLSLQIQLLHLLLTVANSNKGTWLSLLLCAAFLLHVLELLFPATAQKIHTRRRAEKPKLQQKGQRHTWCLKGLLLNCTSKFTVPHKPFLVAVGLLCNFCV